ncbi:hypothetical protein FOQG_16685 [Fusarium oxysporum f. sp. raphani 54005]|uniref:Carboxymuconolactone decarboxylase-like domain-containing protein n=2 Tax=Fusarium oxysporum TaxID=5507 RepID=X0BJL5_FUSOX|nr:hypothetical protein FOVG_14743 [Fusarium oxysporum f. sp. pisi HDV247]EXK78649.1 hypothetical protein FOQG_16685 [Fusarium oxysporum f. sp. raphani 54005]
MDLITTLKKFRSIEADVDANQARWYIVAVAAMAAASAGPDVPKLYALATECLPIDEKKLVQRRLKEAILKTSCLYGVPRSLQALLPLFATIPDDEIDHYGPRYGLATSTEAQKAREEKGTTYFNTLWGEEAARFHRERNFKYQPDLCQYFSTPSRSSTDSVGDLLNLEMIYQWYFSEDTILGPVETQMCNAAALTCSKCPVQAMWHTRGIIRHSGTIDEARFAQEIALAVAQIYGCKIDDITPVDKIDVASKSAE